MKRGWPSNQKSITLRILKATNKLLSHSNKWCKYGGGDGCTRNLRRCLGSALANVAAMDPDNFKGNFTNVVGRIDAALQWHYPDAYKPTPTNVASFRVRLKTRITSFNDHPKTTFKDVKKILKTAISLCK